MTAEQARRFLHAAKGDALFSLYATALGTGLRRGELLALTRRDVDLGASVLRVKAAKTRAGVRSVPLAANVRQALSEAMDARDGLGRTGPIWQVSPWWVTRRFGQLCEKAGLPKIGFHGLRHTAASLLLEQGVDPPAIEAKEPAHFTAAEARRFLEVAKEAADARTYALFAMALGTGLRRGELLGLTWRDCDLEARTVTVRRGKTAASARSVPYPGFVDAALRGVDRRPGPIWPHSPSYVSKRFKTLAAQVGRPELTFHSLRQGMREPVQGQAAQGRVWTLAGLPSPRRNEGLGR